MRLIVCEKKKVAERITYILSNGRFRREYFSGIPVYFFDENGTRNAVIGLRGHILNMDYPPEYNQWRRVNPRELIHVEPTKKVGVYRIYDALQRLAKDVDDIVISTDYDREGELIGVEAIDIIKAVNARVEIKRAKFSSLVHEEIRHAFAHLTDVDFNLARSAEARQTIDLIWGAALTRFVSLHSNMMGKEFLSVGRVQTPTLALVVDLEKLIEAFEPRDYWELIAGLKKNGKTFKAKHQEGRFWDRAKALQARENAKACKEARVTECKKTEVRERPPPPFDTTQFIRAANTFGISAAKAMELAEELYRNGYISYPRTDNTVYPSGLNLRGILRQFRGTEFGAMAEELLALKTLRPTRGKKHTTDHPPIHPVRPAKGLDKLEYKIYELVVRRFFATVAENAVAEQSKAKLDMNGELFLAEGYRLISPGWRKYYPYFKKKDTLLPALAEGEAIEVLKLNLQSKKTKPPKRYTQGSLIQKMETLGLGTKSSRHDIIQKLYWRKYVEDKTPKPTLVGIAVTDALREYASTITEPDMTKHLEMDMTKIAEGSKDFVEVVNESRAMLDEVMKVLEAHSDKLGTSIKHAIMVQRFVGKCPVCGSDMLIIRSKKGKRFVGCSSYPQCTNSYPLPQKGAIVPVGEGCKRCNAPTIKLRGRRPRILCVNMQCPEGNL